MQDAAFLAKEANIKSDDHDGCWNWHQPHPHCCPRSGPRGDCDGGADDGYQNGYHGDGNDDDGDGYSIALFHRLSQSCEAQARAEVSEATDVGAADAVERGRSWRRCSRRN